MKTVGAQGASRRGSIIGLVAIGAISMLALASVVFDLGRVVIGAQRAQDTADAAARAAMTQFPSTSYSEANQRIADTVSANSATTRMPVTCSASETVYYADGATAPGWPTLGAYDEGVTVTTDVPVSFYFAGAVGLTSTTVTRKSTVVTSQAAGAPITPIWIAENTPYDYGVSYLLHMAGSPCYPGIPGNFGWLTPPSGSQDFSTLLDGADVTASMLAANYVTVGTTVWGLPGEKTGQWKSALDDRLSRGSGAPWTNDTYSNFHKDDPRLLIVPMCQYVSGSGSGAQFTVAKFGVFFLQSVSSNAFTSLYTTHMTN